MASRVNKWLFLVVILAVIMIMFGFVFAFGALYLALLEKFNEDRSATATIQSMLLGVTLTFGVFSGILITKFGLPLVTFASSILGSLGLCMSFFATGVLFLYVSIGIVTGISVSLAFFSCVVAIDRIFTGKEKLIALALSNAATSVGGLVYPYYFDFLIRNYGLNGTFLIQGGLFCNCFPFFLLCWINRSFLNISNSLSDDSTEVNTPPHGLKPQVLAKGKTATARKNNDPNSFKAKLSGVVRFTRRLFKLPFISIVLATGLAMSSINGYLGSILDIARWKGLTETQGLSSFIFFNVFEVVSRLMPGILQKLEGVNSFTYPIFSVFCGLLGQIAFYFTPNYVVFTVAVSLTGVAVGGIVSSSIILVVETASPNQVPVASGLVFTLDGLVSMGTGPLYGMIRDRTGSYDIVLLIVGTAQLISIFLYVLASILRRRQNKISDTPPAETVFTVEKVIPPPVVITASNIGPMNKNL